MAHVARDQGLPRRCVVYRHRQLVVIERATARGHVSRPIPVVTMNSWTTPSPSAVKNAMCTETGCEQIIAAGRAPNPPVTVWRGHPDIPSNERGVRVGNSLGPQGFR